MNERTAPRRPTWRRPRPRAERPWFRSVILALLLLVGCGQAYELPEGVTDAQDVPEGFRSELDEAVAEFYERARAGAWTEIYDAVATPVRGRVPADEFLAPLQRVREQIGIPDELELRESRFFRFGPSFPPADTVTAPREGSEFVDRYFLSDEPVQASVVQVGRGGAEQFYYSTLWNREGETWRLDSFFAKPATVSGKDWKAYAEEAIEQRVKDYGRNAALLYNVAIDLTLPAIWIMPAEVDELEKEQRRIRADRMPKGRVSFWVDEPDTFRVYRVSYVLRSEGLGLLVRYQARSDIADTTAQARDGERLWRFVQREFPEYGEVFSTLTLRANDPADPERIWFRIYPLERAP